jgi:cytochrome c553
MLRLLPFLALAALGGCGGAGSGNPAFRASGEVIAFSGGDGGATHACATCHGLQGEGDGRLTPRLAGLDAGYLRRQLDDYANGRREHALMRDIVRRLDHGDRAKVSAYYASLPATGSFLPQTSPLYRAERRSATALWARASGPAIHRWRDSRRPIWKPSSRPGDRVGGAIPWA